MLLCCLATNLINVAEDVHAATCEDNFFKSSKPVNLLQASEIHPNIKRYFSKTGTWSYMFADLKN